MNILYKTDENTPPPFEGVSYYERCCNPFDQSKILSALQGKPAPKLPDSGWMAIDFYENPIGFVPDGSCYEPNRKPEFEVIQGYFDDGRMFSYPKSEYAEELKQRHQKEREKRQAAKGSER